MLKFPIKWRSVSFGSKSSSPGSGSTKLVLVTTMLDAEEYTKEELADLFLQRWNIELDLRSIKDVMQMDVLAVQDAGDGGEGDLDAFISL